MNAIGRRRFLLAAGGCVGATSAFGGFAFTSLWPHEVKATTCSTLALGTEVRITAFHKSAKFVQCAIAAAFEELALVERLMSIYQPDSQVSRLNHTGSLRLPHPYMVEVFRHAQHVSALSGGAFDVTVQPLWEVFANAAKARQIPSQLDIDHARQLVDWRQLGVTKDSLTFGRSGMRVTLNGIAQGFAADRILLALRKAGIENALVDAGEILPLGRPARGETWLVGIQHPRQWHAYIALANLDGRALATSGDYATAFSPDGRHHHIFDPQTGYSPTELASVSILAPTAMAADALSTACFVLGAERSLEMIASVPEVDAYFVLKDGETLATSGFPLAGKGDA